MKHITDEGIEKSMGNLLRLGVLISACIVLLGGVFYIAQHGNELANYRKFVSEPKRLTQFSLIFDGIFRGRGRSIIQAGLFVLIVTPISRILFSIIGYFLEKDYLYLILALLVFVIIVVNLF